MRDMFACVRACGGCMNEYVRTCARFALTCACQCACTATARNRSLHPTRAANSAEPRFSPRLPGGTTWPINEAVSVTPSAAANGSRSQPREPPRRAARTGPPVRLPARQSHSHASHHAGPHVPARPPACPPVRITATRATTQGRPPATAP